MAKSRDKSGRSNDDEENDRDGAASRRERRSDDLVRENAPSEQDGEQDQLAVRMRELREKFAESLKSVRMEAVKMTRELADQSDGVDAASDLMRRIEAAERMLTDRNPRTATPRWRGDYRPRGPVTPLRTLQMWILEALHENSNQPRSTREIAERIHARHHSELTPDDLQPQPSRPTTARWRQTLSVVLSKAKEIGLVERHDDGTWQLTERGINAVPTS